jgi:hypothetical protein
VNNLVRKAFFERLCCDSNHSISVQSLLSGLRVERTRGASSSVVVAEAAVAMPEHWQKVSLGRPSSSQSVAKDVSDLETLVEAKLTDKCVVDRNR